MSEKLLPCPFCGGPAKEPIHYNGTMETGCAGPQECPGTDVLVPLAAWNRRTPTVNLEVGAGDLVARLLTAADHCAEQQAIHGNSIDADCEPHWSSQLEMAEAETACREAAAQLAAVTAENARLRGALADCATALDHAGYAIAADIARAISQEAPK